jgi:hypothetical protein
MISSIRLQKYRLTGTGKHVMKTMQDQKERIGKEASP